MIYISSPTEIAIPFYRDIYYAKYYGKGVGGMGSRVKKWNYELGEKMLKGIEKKQKNYIKKGGKGLKNASFWAINIFFRMEGFPQTYFSGGKNESQKRGGGMINMQNIYPCLSNFIKFKNIKRMGKTSQKYILIQPMTMNSSLTLTEYILQTIIIYTMTMLL